MMAVTFTANFTGSKLLLQMGRSSGCSHFPTVPIQEHGVICISNLVWSLGPWQMERPRHNGKLLVQRKAGFCVGGFIFALVVTGIEVKLARASQLSALRFWAPVWISTIRSHTWSCSRLLVGAKCLLVQSAPQSRTRSRTVFIGSFLPCASFIWRTASLLLS